MATVAKKPVVPHVKAWGKVILDLREQHGVSQRHLAHLASVNRASLRRLEEGTGSGCVQVIERCLAVFGVELDTKEIGDNSGVDPAPDTPARRAKVAAASLLRMNF